ncbi:MAG: hypothetical protein OQK82_03045 [Candidatus Pacearchaeota archaeon]|nr:hypothetical protein [Candidatus Pacearchaeota archaeon]
MRKENRKSLQRKRVIKYSIFGIIFFSLIFIFLLLFAVGFFDLILSFNEKPVLIVIKDECGFILGNLIHNVKSEDDCRLMCFNECDMIEKDFYESEFLLKLDDCNLCDCYCD